MSIIKKSQKGFTLVEIMIVVVIIGLLAAMAIPAFQKVRAQSQTKTCINNLRQISSAKDQYALENGISDNATTIPLANMVGADQYIKSTPVCPIGTGGYTVGDLETAPACDQYDADDHEAIL